MATTSAPKGKALLVKAVLALLALGVLSYGYLPQAACSLEADEDGNPKIVKYIYLSDSRKTATVVFSKDEGGFNVFDDRCQRGTVIGEWQPLKEISAQFTFTQQKCPPQQEYPQQECTQCPWVVGYVTNCETGETDKYLCEGFGKDVDCDRDQDLLMPFG